MAKNMYDQLVAVTNELLGPASERFIKRQIDSHLKIKPEDLTSKDINELAEWIRLSIGMLTDDKETLRTYNNALRELCQE